MRERVGGDVSGFAILVESEDVLLKRVTPRVAGQLREQGIVHWEQAVRAKRDAVGERGFAVGFDGQQPFGELLGDFGHVFGKVVRLGRGQVPEPAGDGRVPSFGSNISAAAVVLPQLLLGPGHGLILRGLRDVLRDGTKALPGGNLGKIHT